MKLNDFLSRFVEGYYLIEIQERKKGCPDSYLATIYCQDKKDFYAGRAFSTKMWGDFDVVSVSFMQGTMPRLTIKIKEN